MNDQLVNFSFQNAPVRGAITQASAAFQELVMQKGNQPPYPLFVKNTLGEMTVILLLMASNLKFQGKMNLQIRGNGYLYSLFTEVQFNGDQPLEIRGLARRQEEFQPTSLDLRDWVGKNASLAITLIPNKGKSYQGVIPIEHPRLTQCIEDYYERSEQIPTYLWTQISDTGCAALMVQHLPSNSQESAHTSNEDQPTMDMETAQFLANTLAPNELLETQPESMLYKLFSEFPVMKHTERHIEYRCSCSSDRMKSALVSLGAHEIKEIALENPIITMNCQFCGFDQQFSAEEVLKTIHEEY